MKNLVLLSAACGVGKSTVRDELDRCAMLDGYACIDTDEVGINWWDYAGSENESKFSEDCLAAAVRMAGDKNLFFVGCLNPLDLFRSVSIPDSITSTYFIGMTCSDGEITRRLRAWSRWIMKSGRHVRSTEHPSKQEPLSPSPISKASS